MAELIQPEVRSTGVVYRGRVGQQAALGDLVGTLTMLYDNGNWKISVTPNSSGIDLRDKEIFERPIRTLLAGRGEDGVKSLKNGMGHVTVEEDINANPLAMFKRTVNLLATDAGEARAAISRKTADAVIAHAERTFPAIISDVSAVSGAVSTEKGGRKNS